MSLIIKPANTTETKLTGPSQNLWNRVGCDADPMAFTTLYEDFASWDETAGAGEHFSLVVENAGTAAHVLTDTGGIITLQGTGTDNDEANLVSGDNVAGFGKFTAGRKFAMEARVAPVLITNDTGMRFVGFAEEALGAGFFTTTSITSKDYVGWQTIAADGDVWEPVYSTEGATAVVVKADAVTTVATTYDKLGVYCDGHFVYWYHNGVPIANCDVRHPVAIGLSGFPDDEEMAVLLSVACSSAAAAGMLVDWIKASMER